MRDAGRIECQGELLVLSADVVQAQCRFPAREDLFVTGNKLHEGAFTVRALAISNNDHEQRSHDSLRIALPTASTRR